jgi:hypothetical protein
LHLSLRKQAAWRSLQLDGRWIKRWRHGGETTDGQMRRLLLRYLAFTDHGYTYALHVLYTAQCFPEDLNDAKCFKNLRHQTEEFAEAESSGQELGLDHPRNHGCSHRPLSGLLFKKRNVAWLQVKVPKGAFCEVYSQFRIGIPPDAVWNILIDPGNKRVFKNIQVNNMLLLHFLGTYALQRVYGMILNLLGSVDNNEFSCSRI